MDFLEFTKKYQNKPVVEYPNQVLALNPNPIVSVIICTYNHDNYISECLDSILSQETNFDFEVLLGDDESDDGTREICMEYAKKYPNKIRLFLHRRENNIILNGSPTGRFNTLYSLFQARGKYIAMCDGDDYWISKNKIQKQYNTMEISPLSSFCYHQALRGERMEGAMANPRFPKKVITLKYLSIFGSLPMGSLFFRNFIPRIGIPDYFLIAPALLGVLSNRLGSFGPGIYVSNIYSFYRVHDQGIYSNVDIRKKAEMSIKARIMSMNNFPPEERKNFLIGIALLKLNFFHRIYIEEGFSDAKKIFLIYPVNSFYYITALLISPLTALKILKKIFLKMVTSKS